VRPDRDPAVSSTGEDASSAPPEYPCRHQARRTNHGRWRRR
jgi:hypothetical protein